jgi:hypothetical protein
VDLESDPVAKRWAATLAHPGGLKLTLPPAFVLRADRVIE